MTGRANGTGRGPFDRWFRYPAGFSRDVLDYVYSSVSVADDALIADPFAGAGSTGTFFASRGHRYIGIEAHPLMSELANLKLAKRPTRSVLASLADKATEAQPV